MPFFKFYFLLAVIFHYNVLPWILIVFMFVNVFLLSDLVSLKSSCTKKDSVFLKANWLISIPLPTSLHTLCFISISFKKENNETLYSPSLCFVLPIPGLEISFWAVTPSPLLWLSPPASCCSGVAVCSWHSDVLEMTCKDTELTACSKSFKSTFLLVFQSEKQTLKCAWSRLFKAVKKIGIQALSRN